MYKIILCLISNFTFLYSTVFEHDPYYQATVSGHPSSYVDGCVSVISGCYIHQHPKIIVKGTEPIDLTRLYISPRFNDPRMSVEHDLSRRLVGWDCSDFLRAKSYVERYVMLPDKNGSLRTVRQDTCFITVTEPCGSVLLFTGPSATIYLSARLTLDKEFFIKGLINCSSGQMSARLNLINTEAILEDPYTLKIIQPDGSIRIYKSEEKSGYNEKKGSILGFQLRQITKPNGNTIFFSYGQKDLIKEIKTKCPNEKKVYAWAKFQYENEKEFFKRKDNSADYTITTSDGKKIFFRHQKIHKKEFDKEGYFFLLKEIICDEFHYKYDYITQHDKTLPMLRFCYTSQERPTFVDYYYAGTKNVEYNELKRLKRDDPRFKRVIALKKPFGSKGDLEITHRLSYDLIKDYNNFFKTIVTDAYGSKTTYFINQDLRIEKIQRDSVYNKHFCTEEFLWGDANTAEQSFLKGKIFYGKNKEPVLAKTYQYDKIGNITVETLYGDLSGTSKPLTIQTKRPIDNGVEKYRTEYSYTKDNRYLLTEIKEQNGLTTKYSYMPTKDLIFSKLICYKDRILKREFYEYNNDLILVRKIIDDGSTIDKDSFIGVTQRTYQEIILKKEEPFIGLPEEVIEMGFCVKTRLGFLLKKTAYTYDLKGNVIQEAIFDGNNKHCYTLHYTYNQRGDLVKETDPLGREAVYAYDLDHNKTYEKDFSGKTTLYKYNRRNNLFKKEIFKGNSPHYITYYDYNLRNQHIITIDPRNHYTIYEKDPFDRITGRIDPHVVTLDKKLTAPFYSTTYDGCGRAIQTVSPLGNITKKSYNIRNKPTKIVYPNNAEERWIYNLDGTIFRHFDKEKVITEYSYDLFKRPTLIKTLSPTEEVLKEESFTYNAFHLISKKDPMGNTTTYSYDSLGRKIQETFEHNGICETVSYQYDALGFLEKKIYEDPFHTLTILYKRDFLGRILEMRKEGNNELFALEKYTYDQAGNKNSITRFIDGKEVTEHFTYDLFNRLIEKIDPLKNTYKTIYDDFYTNKYNQLVIQKIEIDPQGQKTTTEFNAQGNIFSISKDI